MALRYLLDTSVITRLHRAEILDAVDPLAHGGQLARATMSDLEIGYAARNAPEWDRLNSALDAFDAVDTAAPHVRRALQVQRLLAHRSQRGRKIPELLIAAAAEECGLTVLHYDADFERISAVTGQTCQWVVPPGSID